MNEAETSKNAIAWKGGKSGHDLYYFYVVLGEDDPSVVEKFMGFYKTACRFFELFLKRYLETEDGDRLREVTEKASLICYARMIRKLRKRGEPSEAERPIIDRCVKRIGELTAKLDTLAF